MKVSIITVVYNNERTISDSINSVLSQDYKNIEYIIIDGKSKDRTIEIINKYKNNINKFISESDNGIYDAMNKGLQLASGDVIGFLNSDDLYMNNNVISNIVNKFKINNIDSLHADLIYTDSIDINKKIRYWKSNHFIKGSFAKGWHPPHPTFFVKKNIYEKYGYFLLDFRLAADFELMLRFLERYQISNYYLSEPIIKMRLGGVSNKNIKNIIKQNIECFKAFKRNNIKISILYNIYRIIPKIKQYIK